MVKTVDAARAVLAADTGKIIIPSAFVFEHNINFEVVILLLLIIVDVFCYRSNRSPREPYSSRGAQVLSSERSPLLAASSFKPPSFSNMSGECAFPICSTLLLLI